ncbi:Fic family protein [Saliphagus infecundisoli]|uniref:Fic family protein n=1 Tax=Saliphagus infecundisoli TaxID=1849069 RepID=A0ABD5QHY2_9EURY|nr:Fic family protein [Saliphagus infecundisoli]
MTESPEFPDPEDVLAAHDEIEDDYDLTHTGARVVAPRLKIERLLDEIDEHDGLYLRAGYLLKKLITSHYFEDGNKRTSWMVVRDYLAENGKEPADLRETVRVLKRIRAFDPEEIAEWLETGEIDRDRLYPRGGED